jgi:hypothetical protein
MPKGDGFGKRMEDGQFNRPYHIPYILDDGHKEIVDSQVKGDETVIDDDVILGQGDHGKKI